MMRYLLSSLAYQQITAVVTLRVLVGAACLSLICSEAWSLEMEQLRTLRSYQKTLSAVDAVSQVCHGDELAQAEASFSTSSLLA